MGQIKVSLDKFPILLSLFFQTRKLNNLREEKHIEVIYTMDVNAKLTDDGALGNGTEHSKRET